MSQNNVNYSGNPTGPQLLDNYLTPEQTNILSCNSGIQRPSYAIAGTRWLDNSVSPWVLKLYDGSSDVTLGTVNPSTHVFTPSGYIDNTTLVHKTGNETIAGTKTFSSTISGSINGNAATVTNGVYTTGNQTIGGTKTFSSSPLVPTVSSSDNSTKAASTAFVKAQGYVPASSFEEVNVVVETYQGASDWYRVWSDGWIEQGGKSSSRSWTYPKPFSSATSYTIISNNSATSDGYGRPDIIDCTATGATANVNAAAPILWIAMGK